MKRTLLGLLLLAAGFLYSQNNPVTPEYPDPVDDTQLGVFADRAYSTLEDPVTATATTLTLVDGSAFPDAEYWVVICPLGQCGVGASAAAGETVFVTGKASTHVLNIGATGRDVQADQTGTSTGDGGNPTHAAGEAVVLMPPAGWYNRITAELKELHDAIIVAGGHGALVGAGPYSSLPGSGTNGEIYHFNGETPYHKAIHDGTDWVPYYLNYACEPITLGDFSWINQGTATATTSGGAILTTVTNDGQIHALVKSAPATPYTIEGLMYTQYPGGDSGEMGLIWRQSSDGKLIYEVTRPNNDALIKRDSPSASLSTYVARSHIYQYNARWIRLTDNGTNRIVQYSFDGWYWETFHTVSRTDYMTADQVGFFVVNNGGASPVSPSIFLSWKQY